MVAEQARDSLVKEIKKRPKVKCVVWDLDNTLWDGVLLEDEEVTLRPDAVEAIKALDERGILHSIASKNDHATAMHKLEEFGIKDYFLYPQINWNPKSSSILEIAKSINIGIDTLALLMINHSSVKKLSSQFLRCYAWILLR